MKALFSLFIVSLVCNKETNAILCYVCVKSNGALTTCPYPFDKNNLNVVVYNSSVYSCCMVFVRYDNVTNKNLYNESYRLLYNYDPYYSGLHYGLTVKMNYTANSRTTVNYMIIPTQQRVRVCCTNYCNLDFEMDNGANSKATTHNIVIYSLLILVVQHLATVYRLQTTNYF